MFRGASVSTRLHRTLCSRLSKRLLGRLQHHQTTSVLFQLHISLHQSLNQAIIHSSLPQAIKHHPSNPKAEQRDPLHRYTANKETKREASCTVLHPTRASPAFLGEIVTTTESIGQGFVAGQTLRQHVDFCCCSIVVELKVLSRSRMYRRDRSLRCKLSLFIQSICYAARDSRSLRYQTRFLRRYKYKYILELDDRLKCSITHNVTQTAPSTHPNNYCDRVERSAIFTNSPKLCIRSNMGVSN